MSFVRWRAGQDFPGEAETGPSRELPRTGPVGFNSVEPARPRGQLLTGATLNEMRASWLLRALLLSLAAPGLVPAAEQDHLVVEAGPFAGSGTEEYHAALARILITDPYRGVQMVVVPSFMTEYAVYIAERPDRGEGEGRVVLARMKKPLWAEMMRRIEARATGRSWSVGAEAQRAALAEIVPEIERFSAPISGRAEERLHAVWRAALLGARLPGSRTVMGLDGVTYHFADFERGVGYRSGSAWSPGVQTRIGALVDLGNRLAAYAAADGTRRSELEADLMQRADALLARF